MFGLIQEPLSPVTHSTLHFQPSDVNSCLYSFLFFRIFNNLLQYTSLFFLNKNSKTCVTWITILHSYSMYLEISNKHLHNKIALQLALQLFHLLLYKRGSMARVYCITDKRHTCLFIRWTSLKVHLILGILKNVSVCIRSGSWLWELN